MSSPDAVDVFLSTAAARPSCVAIESRAGAVTYAALERRVREFARCFAEGEGGAVLIALPACTDAYAAMFGAALAGCFYAPVNVEAPLEKLQRIARILQPRHLLVADPALAEALSVAAPQARKNSPGDLAVTPLSGPGKRHAIAYVMFTSGTSGLPKGVVVPRTALNHYLAWVQRSQTVVAGDRVAQFSNLAFDVSVTDIYGALCSGATLLPVLGRSDRTFPGRMIARERISVWNSTPSVVSLMMRAGDVTCATLASLRLVNMLGEPLLRAHLEALFGARPDLAVQNTYGPTETTVSVTELRLDRASYGAACGSSVAIGTPIEGMALDLAGGESADEGEIVIRGPQLAAGYWNDAEATRMAFRDIDVDGRPARGYFTGDWAVRREGRIYFKERIDQQVKIRGFRLELDEVARAIHDAGYPVACVLKWRDELAAVIEAVPGRAFDELALRTALGRSLEAHAVPALIRAVGALPRNANDKLDRRAIAQWLEAGAVDAYG